MSKIVITATYQNGKSAPEPIRLVIDPTKPWAHRDRLVLERRVTDALGEPVWAHLPDNADNDEAIRTLLAQALAHTTATERAKAVGLRALVIDVGALEGGGICP